MVLAVYVSPEVGLGEDAVAVVEVVREVDKLELELELGLEAGVVVEVFVAVGTGLGGLGEVGSGWRFVGVIGGIEV